MDKTVALTHKEYLESGVWKCTQSPTGAHYWVEINKNEETRGLFLCKYCLDVKRFPVGWGEAVAATASGKIRPIILKAPERPRDCDPVPMRNYRRL